MSYLDKLLDGVEVEWKPLGEVFDTRNGYTPSKANNAFWTNGTIPWYRMEDIRINGRILSDAIQHITPESIKATGLFKKNSIIMATTATIGEHALLIADSLANQQFTNFSIRKSLQNRLLPIFVFYYFFKIDEWCLNNVNISSFPSVDIKHLKKVLFPIPPIKVQTEIVHILDKFSTLTAELQAELQARKSQYEYYRDQLLDYPMEESDQPSLRSSRSATSIQKSDNPSPQQSALNPLTDNSVLPPRGKVEWKTLGEIGTLTIGRRFVRTDIQESGVPCFHYGDLYTYYGISTAKTKGYLSEILAKKLRFAQPNDVVIVCAGENDMDIGVGVAWLGDEPAVVHDACCILHHNQNPKYISHFLRTHNYHIQIKKYVKNGKISSLPISGLKKAVIPVPSLAEQDRIVSILDKFDSLTNSISEGLPKLIELSQKRYEYYRDLLLSFPKDEIKA